MIRKILISIILALGLLLPVSAQAFDPLQDVCPPGTPSTTSACQNRSQTLDDNSLFGSNGILTKAARIITMLVGVASVIMIIIGGVQYITSSGDPTNVSNAKNTILYAIIGLVVALLAQAIISFVLVRI